MQGYNVQEAGRMSVAIHPSEARPSEARAQARFRLPVIAGVAGGGVALVVFAVGAFSFFSDLADPRSRPTRIAPVASQWPDLKDGVPALAPTTGGPVIEPRRASLPSAEPAPAPSPPLPVQAAAAIPVAAPAQATAPAQTAPTAQATLPAQATPPTQAALPARGAATVQAAAASPARGTPPIEPASTLPATGRTAAALAPAKVTVPLPPSRSETVRAKTEQPAKFVSLPAPKAKPEIAKAEARVEAKSESKPEAKAETAKADAARKAMPAPRNRTAETRPTQTASAQPPAANPAQDSADEPELLGVKIPGGRQIREGWDAAVSGLLGKKSGNE
ncbi:hypothetical protein LNAOJCKE_3116 [Methylorubrum aminovorans]|uniref:Uncharacterized protein n=2 Tax=Methylorubrum aminovorans TaxID=269069 RepID=A0ABQ4UHA2_9HYPH|nr:hypothetical protein LNAOJCKE_3116 [Methylorubrum aminovorans]